MNENIYRLKDIITQENNNVVDVYSHNFSHKKNREFLSGEDNSLFIAFTKEKYKYIKITHKIKSDIDGLRLKLYYASSPENAFCEEQSFELGFMDGEEYTYILRLKNISDAFRVDFGFKPISFEFEKFKIEKPSVFEVIRKISISAFKNFRSVIRYISNNGINLSKILRKVKEAGLIGALQNAKERAALAIREGAINKITQQVVEPYQVTIKQKVEPNRKKVLHFIENFYTGGSSRLIIDIIEYYGHKYDNKIFTMAYRGKEEFLDVDVEVIDIDNKKDVLKKIKEYTPDVIHVHIWEGEWYHKVFNLLQEVNNIKMIENINTPIEPILREYVDKYVFVSNYVLENFHKKDDNKSMVIYPGSNFDMFTRKLDGDYLAKDTIGMVYRLGYDKLNQYSIDVFIKTVKKRPQTKAIIVGGGPQYEYYVDKVKRAGVFKNFIFTGYIPYNSLPGWYEKFTIFVAPVWKESFGQVSPFAMSMGIPVAGYDIGALSEIIGSREFLTPSDDSDKLSDVLVRLLDNYEQCKEIGRFNQQRAWDNFGVKTMVDAYDKVYNELLER